MCVSCGYAWLRDNFREVGFVQAGFAEVNRVVNEILQELLRFERCHGDEKHF